MSGTDSKTKAQRVILLGLDGGTFYLLKPWIEDGLMPNLGALMKQGTWGDLASTIPATTPPAWSTCVTGKNPGKHSVLDFRESFLRDRQRPLINSKSIRAKKLWQILADHDKRVGLVSVPITYPPQPVNGFVISGLLTPDGESNYTYPAELKDELLSAIGDFVVNIDIPKYDVDALDDALAFLDEILYSFQKRKEAFFHLLTERQWDFFMIVFIFADRIQHLFWKYIDPQTKLFNSKRASQLRDKIRECYAAFDEMLGQLEARLDDDTQLFIMSDHGFGATRAWINVNTYLARLGLLKLKRGEALRKRLFTTAMNVGESSLVKTLLPEKLQRAVRGRVRSTRSSFKSDVESAIDWDRTQAFFASIPTQGIFINIKRDGFGVVDPGEEYQQLRELIKNKLLELRDPWTKEPVVDKIWFKEEIYQGPQAKYAPDLVFISKGYAYLGRQLFGDHKIIRSAENLPVGFHRSDGIFIARGSMAQQDREIRGAEIADIAPTVLYAMGLPVPDDMDGKVLGEVFGNELLKQRPVEFEEAAEDQAEDEEEIYSQEESEKIKERLKSLGYIE
ncbi:alkaline phosphatase family protein [Candidatus Zixiibacteriota bacterium]